MKRRIIASVPASGAMLALFFLAAGSLPLNAQRKRTGIIVDRYATLCAACHGANLEGGQASSLVDDVWSHGAGRQPDRGHWDQPLGSESREPSGHQGDGDRVPRGAGRGNPRPVLPVDPFVRGGSPGWVPRTRNPAGAGRSARDSRLRRGGLTDRPMSRRPESTARETGRTPGNRCSASFRFHTTARRYRPAGPPCRNSRCGRR